MSDNNHESQYAKEKRNSMIMAFSIAAVANIALSYVKIDVWWGKFIFEVAARIAALLISGAMIYELILRVKYGYGRNKIKKVC
ncbi:MAG: hypothetical protein FWE62_01930 [Firmicutes bacterium]|nr:hypothetical protein [Bacillota bacterium]